MKELTEMEVCKKIAKIEGHEFASWSEKAGKPSILKVGTTNQGKHYNPLTNDALCFQLMVKYNVMICRFSDGYYFTDESPIGSKSPNRAICLGIINDKLGLVT